MVWYASENQDACAVLTPDGYTVAVVCDGMGGTQGGRMASAIAVETFTRELSRSLRPGMSAGQLEQAAGYAVALSNDAVREYGLAHPGFERMGTTLVSAVVPGRSGAGEQRGRQPGPTTSPVRASGR